MTSEHLLRPVRLGRRLAGGIVKTFFTDPAAIVSSVRVDPSATGSGSQCRSSGCSCSHPDLRSRTPPAPGERPLRPADDSDPRFHYVAGSLPFSRGRGRAGARHACRPRSAREPLRQFSGSRAVIAVCGRAHSRRQRRAVTRPVYPRPPRGRIASRGGSRPGRCRGHVDERGRCEPVGPPVRLQRPDARSFRVGRDRHVERLDVGRQTWRGGPTPSVCLRFARALRGAPAGRRSSTRTTCSSSVGYQRARLGVTSRFATARPLELVVLGIEVLLLGALPLVALYYIFLNVVHGGQVTDFENAVLSGGRGRAPRPEPLPGRG